MLERRFSQDDCDRDTAAAPHGDWARGASPILTFVASSARDVTVDLPGFDLVSRGIADLERGDETIASLVVSIGAARLVRLGLPVRSPIAAPEHRLYERLAAVDSDSAHSRYNALVRRLVSFERAAECAS